MNQDQQHRLNEQLKNTLGKLEHDIERHRGERQYHMRRTNSFVKLAAVFLLVMGVFNGLYLWDFYIRMQEIVTTITGLGQDVTAVSVNMVSLTDTMQKFDTHMNHMPGITGSAISMSEQMSPMNQSIGQMLANMNSVNGDMALMRHDVVEVNQRFSNITRGVSMMGNNVNAISGPMGMFNSIMP